MTAAATPQQSTRRRGPEAGRSTKHLWPAILTLAAREQGVSIAEVKALDAALTDKRVSSVLAYLRDRGQLHVAEITHKIKTFHSTAAAAQRALAAGAGLRAKAMRRKASESSRHHAPWPADAEPVITAATRITIAPTPPRALKTNTHSQF